MLKKSAISLLGILLLLTMAAMPALGYVAAGDKLGELEFSAPLAAEDATYLGVPAGKPFKLSQVSAPYVLIEVFGTGCPHCVNHAPQLNTLYGLVSKDAALAGKIKFIGLASGDGPDNVATWKKTMKVPFALVPDADTKTATKINVMGTPTTVVMNKNGDVVWAKAGGFGDPAAFVKELQGLLK